MFGIKELKTEVELLSIRIKNQSDNLATVLEKLEKYENKLVFYEKNYEKNAAKLDEMMRELKGCVAMSRAALKENQEEAKKESKKK